MRAFHIFFQLSITALVVCKCLAEDPTFFNGILAGGLIVFDLFMLPRWLRD